jgi:DNA-binding response OmpR family regulator
LLITALDASSDKVEGLDSGADDYVVKPLDPPELMARIRALSRRAQISEPTVLRWGDLQLNPGMHEVSFAGHSLHLTPKEYNILELLMHHGRQVLKRITIVEHVWSLDDPPREDTINATIKSLRNKLKSAGAPHNLIETIHGVGYRLSQLS